VLAGLLSILAIVVVLFLLRGAFKWMSARWDSTIRPEKAARLAKQDAIERAAENKLAFGHMKAPRNRSGGGATPDRS
jgi:hypothetical protein